MSSVRFAVTGAKGRMGQAVIRVLKERGLEIVTEIDKDDVPDFSQTDAIIDFSTPAASLSIAKAAAAEGAKRGKPLTHVIGSTGFMPQDDEALNALTSKVVVIRSGNYSLGVNILMGLVKQAAEKLSANDWDIEVLEAHHKRKVDAPSGTALMLGEAAAEGRNVSLPDVRVAGRDGLTGQRETGTIGFSVIRGGGIVGEHSVLFASEDEIITLSHSARDRTLFARGAIEAALYGVKQPVGLYNMQDVLGF